MQRAMWFRVTVGGALVSLSACASPTSPNSVRVVGILDGGDPDAEVLESPDSARVGIPLVVRVTTYGSGSCTRADGADVRDVTLNSLRREVMAIRIPMTFSPTCIGTHNTEETPNCSSDADLSLGSALIFATACGVCHS